MKLNRMIYYLVEVHLGNIRFRNMIHSYKVEYMNALNEKKKDQIAKIEMNAIITMNGGRFLRKLDNNSQEVDAIIRYDGILSDTTTTDYSSNVYVIVNDQHIILKKVKDAFRAQGRSIKKKTKKILLVSNHNKRKTTNHRHNNNIDVAADAAVTTTCDSQKPTEFLHSFITLQQFLAKSFFQ